jgi:hypothetical protein
MRSLGRIILVRILLIVIMTAVGNDVGLNLVFVIGGVGLFLWLLWEFLPRIRWRTSDQPDARAVDCNILSVTLPEPLPLKTPWSRIPSVIQSLHQL